MTQHTHETHAKSECAKSQRRIWAVNRKTQSKTSCCCLLHMLRFVLIVVKVSCGSSRRQHRRSVQSIAMSNSLLPKLPVCRTNWDIVTTMLRACGSSTDNSCASHSSLDLCLCRKIFKHRSLFNRQGCNLCWGLHASNFRHASSALGVHSGFCQHHRSRDMLVTASFRDVQDDCRKPLSFLR